MKTYELFYDVRKGSREYKAGSGGGGLEVKAKTRAEALKKARLVIAREYKQWHLPNVSCNFEIVAIDGRRLFKIPWWWNAQQFFITLVAKCDWRWKLYNLSFLTFGHTKWWEKIGRQILTYKTQNSKEGKEK